MSRLSAEQLSSVAVSLIEPSGTTIVLLDQIGTQNIETLTYNSNIYCLSQQGDIVWQIQADGGIYDRDSFVSMVRTPDGAIEARRFFGSTYSINPTTGIAELTGWSK